MATGGTEELGGSVWLLKSSVLATGDSVESGLDGGGDGDVVGLSAGAAEAVVVAEFASFSDGAFEVDVGTLSWFDAGAFTTGS